MLLLLTTLSGNVRFASEKEALAIQVVPRDKYRSYDIGVGDSWSSYVNLNISIFAMSF